MKNIVDNLSSIKTVFAEIKNIIESCNIYIILIIFLLALSVVHLFPVEIQLCEMFEEYDFSTINEGIKISSYFIIIAFGSSSFISFIFLLCFIVMGYIWEKRAKCNIKNVDLLSKAVDISKIISRKFIQVIYVLYKSSLLILFAAFFISRNNYYDVVSTGLRFIEKNDFILLLYMLPTAICTLIFIIELIKNFLGSYNEVIYPRYL